MAFFNLIAGASVNLGTLVTDMLFAVCGVLLLGYFEPRPSVVARRLLEAAAVFLVSCSLDVICDCIGISDYPSPTLLSLALALAFYAFTQTRLTPTDRIARCATFVAVFALVVVLTRTIIPATPRLQSLEFGYSIPSLVSFACMVGAALWIRKFSPERFAVVPGQYLLLILAIDVLGAVSGYSFIILHETYDFLDNVPTSGSFLVGLSRNISLINLVVCVGFILLTVLAYLMFYLIAREHSRHVEMLVLKRSETDTTNVAAATKAMYDSMREMRHEIKNHDAYMSALLEAGNYDALRDFLKTYAVSHEEATHYVTSGNPTVDAVVNAKVALARSAGLRVETMLAVPADLPFEDDDFFCLLANLLDNAIEGASACATGADVPIQLKVKPEAGYYFVSVANRCDPAAVRHGPGGELVTTKRDSEVHGFGTKVIRRIAEKYRGSARFHIQGDTFVASVMLVPRAGEGPANERER